MKTWKTLASLRAVSVALLTAVFIAACGGSGSSAPEPVVETSDTGTVGLWFTDLPTDDFSSIILTVSEASLIGGDGERQVLFTGKRDIDLLNLTNYSEPVVFGEVKAGNYSKIRLMITDIELVRKSDGESILVEKLPANGKVDLLDPEGFDIIPGRHLAMEIDIDADKAIHVVGAGNSGKYKFRPVAKLNIYESGPGKLARIKGAVSGAPDQSDGTFAFTVCGIETPDLCIDVVADLTPVTGTSFFGENGEGGADYTLGIVDGAMVVVIGEYSNDPDVLNAAVVEISSGAEQVTGMVGTEPNERSQFLVLTVDDESLIVELQDETKYYNDGGPINKSAVVFGARVEVEGVRHTSGDPDFRAALVFLEAPEDTLLSGTVMPMSQKETDTTLEFELVPEGTDPTPVNVCLDKETSILLVNTTDMTATSGDFTHIVDDAIVDVFGTPPEAGGGCFSANEVIVDVTPAP